MKVIEKELPGIGRKVEITTRENDKIVVVSHDEGMKEIHKFDQDDHEECVASMLLHDNEARQISAILGGIIYKPKAIESIETILDEVIIEWYPVEAGAPVIQKTIGNVGIRHVYEVTIIAIIRKSNEKILNPGPDVVLEEGDKLIISGERKQLRKIRDNLLTKNN